jgi:hypothetical protein
MWQDEKLDILTLDFSKLKLINSVNKGKNFKILIKNI